MNIERIREWATTDCGIKNIEHRGGYEHAQFDVKNLISAEIRRQSDNEPTVEEIARVTRWMLRMREAVKRGVTSDDD